MANADNRQDLARELNAAAVEMEGAAVAQVAARFGVPVLVIRNARGSYQQFLETASRNAAVISVATIREFVKESR